MRTCGWHGRGTITRWRISSRFRRTWGMGISRWRCGRGNEAIAMGAAAAGLKFYAAYPMSPSSGILHWMASNARSLGIMVRQVEDEIGVANMTIGAAHAGCRAMCGTSGGGFALMTEAIGAAGMMEIPAVFVNVQRAGRRLGCRPRRSRVICGRHWGRAKGISNG